MVPRLSCDGSEHYLTTADYVRSAPRPYPTEKRQSGLHKGDIDGDGVARLMRVPSPYGVWKISPKDPRLMVRRRPDETDGEFYNVYPEGIIENYDGLHVTMAPSEFGNDFNRNYPIGWQDESQQAGAGAHPPVSYTHLFLPDNILMALPPSHRFFIWTAFAVPLNASRLLAGSV